MQTANMVLLSLLLAGVLAACSQQPVPPVSSEPASPAKPANAPVPLAEAPGLRDIAESDPRYVIGISYPAQANQYPILAKAISDYAEAARAELMQAVTAMGQNKPPAPYELSLAFEMVAQTPEVVAVAADGGRYTGGAHGEPLVARFTWLPKQEAWLTTEAMLPSAAGMEAVSRYVREQLRTSLSLRVEGQDVPPEERAQLLQPANEMIDKGTEPKAANFSQFQPVMNADGRIAAIRFVFPPYQVGAYAEGTQTVDVPAQVLQPYVAPEYAALFLK